MYKFAFFFDLVSPIFTNQNQSKKFFQARCFWPYIVFRKCIQKNFGNFFES